jgi:hypothetical protein
VAIRYRFNFPVEAAAARVLDEIETRLTWRPSRNLSLFDRFRKVALGLLALKELDYLGRTQDGGLNERAARLIDAILGPLEKEWTGGNGEGHAVARVKRLRTAILPDMIKGEISEEEKARRWRQLDSADIAQRLYHYPPGYLGTDAPPGRIIETAERFEEDVTGKIRVHGPIEAVVTVGEPIEVSAGREARGESDPLMTAIETQWKTMLSVGGQRIWVAGETLVARNLAEAEKTAADAASASVSVPVQPVSPEPDGPAT